MHERLTTKPATPATQAACHGLSRGDPAGGDGESESDWRTRMQADHCDGTTWGVRRETLVCGLVAGVCLIAMVVGLVVWVIWRIVT